MNSETSISTYEEIFKDRLNGCTIRMIKVADDLNSISVIDNCLLNSGPDSTDYLNFSFSKDGKYLVIYSKSDNFIKLFNG
jgi:hypothetical protein